MHSGRLTILNIVSIMSSARLRIRLHSRVTQAARTLLSLSKPKDAFTQSPWHEDFDMDHTPLPFPELGRIPFIGRTDILKQIDDIINNPSPRPYIVFVSGRGGFP